ncbi:nitronate monooxygenase [Paenibacillus marchantiophytorum]|uniref:Probable nitronate monooxygenase n=1 Tax=Paenibacillus marchantiophytorum TaxID=1619310 RepID=A0ABQ1EUW8_9BACL|nr:nitronate monooxygenase [Paenibacillus marchantiophytorum]GFZ88613.1 nitronate monooxygenase [Paenibacillus marchantiophytorum]
MKLQLDTPLCQQFGIRYPIFLAGMAGGPSTVRLTSAVSNAGGLGTLGAAYMKPDAIRAAIREVREQTAAPFGVNLFSLQMHDDKRRIEAARHAMIPIRKELGLTELTTGDIQSANDFDEQIQVLLEEKVPVISTAFGLLPESYMRQAKSAGLMVVSMVTTVQEALMAQEAGCDAVVAQGSEAGGHRGTFDMTTHPMGANIGTFALVPQIVDKLTIPVIAAGGIMDGRGLVAALALGAQGVQMGTRFLTASECGANPAYKRALLASTEESTVLTKAFSGRPARGIQNAFIRQWAEGGTEPLPFPTQNTLTREIRNAAAQQENAEYMSLWAGQGTRLLTPDQSAAEIVVEVIQQAKAIVGSSRDS